MAWFGADPGGANAFGVALLDGDGSFESAVVSCADEAIECLRKSGARIEATGVDAPLWWSSGESGDRLADQAIRKKLHSVDAKDVGGTVQPANSLRGAALVQGVMLAALLRQRCPEVLITECHPKALLKLWGIDAKEVQASLESVRGRFGLADGVAPSEHERDALIAAIAAREGAKRRWKRDLSRERFRSEQDPDRVSWGPVSYWWPEELNNVNEIG
jgi:predicted nuclease with RNAse H fold